MKPESILETALYGSDLEQLEAFYGSVLGLRLNSKEEGRHVFFECGDDILLLFDPDATCVKTGVVPPHGTRGQGHVAFAIDESDYDPWRERLNSHGVDVEAEIDWPGGGHSIYFRDPAGNSVELTTPRTWTEQ